MKHTAIASSLLVSGALAMPAIKARQPAPADAPACFPYGNVTLPSDYSAPSVARDDWWCSSDLQYGFQGFAYPLEDGNCDDDGNQFDTISADFAEMKKFGATMVVPYLPTCTSESLWVNLLKAGVANNMGVILQVDWSLDDPPIEDQWSNIRDSIYSVFEDDQWKAIAPYVFHSADFGTEPIGDYVDGCDMTNGQASDCSQFISDLKDFKTRMNGYGIPVGISEDWDRIGHLTNDDTGSLTDLGSALDAASDFIHLHIQPYYYPNGNYYQVSDGSVWSYVQQQTQNIRANHGDKPILITETQWSWGTGNDHGDHDDVGVEQYQKFINDYNDNCQFFKDNKVGWFIHAWAGESTFSFKKDDGSYIESDFFGKYC